MSIVTGVNISVSLKSIIFEERKEKFKHDGKVILIDTSKFKAFLGTEGFKQGNR
jgi:hypothetical protein